MAEGHPDWTGAVAKRAQPALKSRKLPIRDGHHNHAGDDDDGAHGHQDLSQHITDHEGRLRAIEAHLEGGTSAHMAHAGHGNQDG